MKQPSLSADSRPTLPELVPPLASFVPPASSSVDTTHDALMMLYSQRFAEQIELADAETILESWPRA